MYKRRKYCVTAEIHIGGNVHVFPFWFTVDDVDGNERGNFIKATQKAHLVFRGNEYEDKESEFLVYEPTFHPAENDAYFTFKGITVERPTTKEMVVEVAINRKFRTVQIKTTKETYVLGVWGNDTEENFDTDCDVLFKGLQLK